MSRQPSETGPRQRASVPPPDQPIATREVLTLQSIACGVAVVAVVAVPALFNPRGHDAFTVIKTGLLEGFGPVAALCAALASRSDSDRLRGEPVLLAGGAVAATLVLATAFGIAPTLSFFAPGARHEGTYLALSLVAIGFAVATLKRSQVEIVLDGIIIGSIGPSVFAVVQTIIQPADPTAFASLPRVGGTFGNPVLLGGYLAPVIPITAARALGALAVQRGPERGSLSRWSSVGYWIVLSVQLAALCVAKARGAWLAMAIAAIVIAIGTMDGLATRRRFVALLAAGALVLAVVGGVILTHGGFGTLAMGPTLEVRALIWRQVARLIGARPGRLPLGYGPEMLRSVVGPFLSPDLARLEGAFAVPDRAHNDLLDTLVSTGLFGALAIIALHVLLWTRLREQLSSPRSVWTMSQWTALGLLAGALAHFVEIQVGIATAGSRLIWWCIVGMAVAATRDRSAAVSEAGVIHPSDRATAIAAAVALAALVFVFWQGQAGVSFAPGGIAVVSATGVIAATVGRRWRITGFRVVAGRLAAIVAIAGGMVAMLAFWNLRSADEVLAMGEWMSHQATACYLLLGMAAGAVACAVGSGGGTQEQPRVRVRVAADMAIGVLGLAFGARPVRADILAHLGDEMQAAQRWTEAEAFYQRRVQLVPESDSAWSALGGAELELARRAALADRADRFTRVVSALAEARRRNPTDWFHCRNQASAERVWAAADPAGRAAHLAAADDFYRQATSLAPASARLWAEWGNVDAERGALHDAFGKLEHAAILGDEVDAGSVASAILRATGVDLGDPNGRARAVAELNREGCPTLARLYTTQPDVR